MTRLTVVLGAIFALLVLTSLLIKKSVRAEIVIAAKPEAVWATITNPATYGEWNPIFVAYEGAFGEGNSLSLQMKMGEADPVMVDVKVKNFVVEEWLHQSGGYPTFLTYDHNWYLEAVPEGTKVIQYEYYTGLYVLFWDPSPALLAYKESNKNLKARLETAPSQYAEETDPYAW